MITALSLAVLLWAYVDAEITSVSYISPRHGSLNGHTLLTITGTGFAKNLFNHGPGNEKLGNQVKLVSATRSYDCDILKDGCHEFQVTCYTRAMVEDRYYARVSVDGNAVPIDEHCRWEYDYRCSFQASSRTTPYVSWVEPSSAPPGSIIKVHGRLMTSLILSTQGTGTNGRTERIRRVYFGTQLCELFTEDEPDEIYGIELANSGRSEWGWFKCKLEGDFIGNFNVSFIIEGGYGRSKPQLSTMSVSGSGQLHMFQSYAVINDVNPKAGSIEGGTEMHISGNYFDTYHPVRVDVGDQPCEVLSVTIDEIICRTPSKPVNLTTYAGNRGVWVHQWHVGHISYDRLPEIANYSFNGSEYRLSWYDGAGFSEHSDSYDVNNYGVRVRGYFVPPKDGEYQFYLLADDSGQVYFSENDNPRDKELIMFCEAYCPSHYEYDSQISRRFNLTAGQRYFFETLSAEYSGEGYIKVGVKIFQSVYNRYQSDNIHNEMQTIFINSTQMAEKQVVSFRNWTIQEGVSEVQRINITMHNGSDSNQADIKFGFSGAYTGTVPLGTSAADMESMLNELMAIITDPVSLQKDGEDIIVTFPPGLGDVPELNVVITPPGITTVNVTEVTRGVSDLTHVHLELDGVPSPAIPQNALAQQVESALWEMFSTRCSASISTSEEDLEGRRKYHYSFESSVDLPSHTWGTVSYSSDPFCGRGSLSNPSYLYSEPLSQLRLYMYSKMCFAYKGEFEQYFNAEFSWTNDVDEDLSLRSEIPVDLIADDSWHYTCIDLQSLVQAAIEGPSSKHMLTSLEIVPLSDDCYVDEVEYGVAVTVPSTAWPDMAHQRLSPPMGVIMKDISVNRTGESEYEITLEPYDCAYDFSLIGLLGLQMTTDDNDSAVFSPNISSSNMTVTVERVQAASPRVSGSFDLSFRGQFLTGIAADIEAEELQSALRTLSGMGHVEVTRFGDCSGYSWTIQWVDLGDDQPLAVVNDSQLVGNNVSITTWSDVDGGILYNIIPGEFLQTYEEEPQVVVHINNIPTACVGNCSFNWTEELTASITAINPTSGSLSASTVLTITGTGFQAVEGALNNSTVIIAGVLCEILSTSDTEIECEVGEGPLGSHDVEVNVGGKGLAAHDSSRKQFSYTGVITSISPMEGSNSGGLSLRINGSGFGNESTVTVGGEDCFILNYTYTSITCQVPAKGLSAPSAAPVVVSHPEGSLTSDDDFTYSNSLTPMVTAISVTSSRVVGGDLLVISGTNLEPSGDQIQSVFIDTAEARIINSNDTEISVILPAHFPGSHSVTVQISGVGYADTLTNNIPVIEYILSVDAVTPVAGSLMGGTRLTLHGDGFPESLTNSSLTVTVGNETGCDVENTSANQIVCVLELPGREHVITNSGNHPVYGSGFAWKPSVLEVMAGDTVTFRWEVPQGVQGKGYAVIQINGPSDTNTTEGGFHSGEKTPIGSFRKMLAVSGDYHFSSGSVDEFGDIVMKGVIKVRSRPSSMEEVKVQVAGFEAEYVVGSGVTISPDASCHDNGESESSDCAEDEVMDHTIDGSFNFTFTSCLTPTIKRVEPSKMYVNEAVVITGTGFSVNPCENEVLIGDSPCIANTSTDTNITCFMDLSSNPAIYTRLPVTVRVKNTGDAMWTTENLMARSVVFQPYYALLSPVNGSLAGGTFVNISGAGFSEDADDLEVRFGGSRCIVAHATYSEIICETESGDAGLVNATVLLNINGFPNELNCTNIPCSFEYSHEVTTIVNNMYPTNIAGLSNTIALDGNFSDINEADVGINVGLNMCDIAAKNDTTITCRLTNLLSSSHDLSMRINPSGLANISIPATITVAGNIDSITPSMGSMLGGTEVEILGSVFDPESALVLIGGSKCEIQSVSYDNITCVTSEGPGEGVADVVVTSNDITITGSGMYDYSSSSTPVITSVTPVSASTSGSITLAGTGFSSTPGDNSVTIGNYSCTATSSNPSQLLCAYDDLPAGVYSIHLNVAGVGRATAESIVFQYEPTVSDVSPSSGSFGGGQLVTVSGSGFDAQENATSVRICDETCKNVNVAATEVQCLTAENLGSETVECDVSISVNHLNTSLTDAYTYDMAKTPVILGVSPRRGGTGGGTRLTINGTDFGNTPSAITVTIEDIPCDVDTSETTPTVVVCVTNSIPITTQTKVRLQVSDYGIASQESADFEYIDVWSSVWTWGGESLPVEGDLVVIQRGQTVLLDTDTPVLKMLLIQGGSLIFDRKDIELNAEYILVTNGGLFQVGTESEPFMNKANIKLHGHWRSQELPVYGAKTLAVRDGTLDLHGRPTPVTWAHLESTAEEGATEITLRTPVNWLPGDLVIFASTGHRHSQRENELKQITAVSEDGLTLTLNESLQYDHISETEIIDGEEIALRGEVGVLSHSITIQGSNDAQWHQTIEACPDGFDTGEFSTQTCFQGRFGKETDSDGYGVHIMLHTPALNTGTLIARIEYVEINYAGQKFRLGRYPIHFHLLGNMDGAYVRGCGIHQTFNRAINIHGTHNVLIEHNVVYNVHGGALFLEDGIETGNIFQYNLAVFVKSSTSLLNDDITPASFWITNPNNTYRHNAAAGGTHFGYWYRMHDHPDGPSFTTSICPKKIPLLEFYNNTAHSFGWFGLWIFQEYFPTADGSCSSTTAAPAVFQNLTAWNCEKGAEWVNCGDMQFKGFKMVNNEKAGIEMKMISSSHKFDPEGPLIEDAIIVGHSSVSSSDECTTKGIILPFDSGLTVVNSKFINFDRSCQTFGIASIDGKCVSLCGGWHYHVTGLQFFNAPNKLIWRWEHEGVIVDLDGSFTGIQGAKVVPDSNILPASQCEQQQPFSMGFPGAVCEPSVNFVRFAFNHINPPSLKFKNALFENSNGISVVPYAFKRLTHKEGWMLLMPSGEDYKMNFENAPQITNISYDGIFYELRDNDHAIVIKNLTTTPDRFNVKPGGNRDRSQEELTYQNNVDGDWFFNFGMNKLSFLISHKTESRRKRNILSPSLINSAVQLQVYKCYYTDCIAPVDMNTIPPADTRPDVYFLWSAASTWEVLEQDKPESGDSVLIKRGYWVVVDEPIPALDALYVEGVLEFEYKPKRQDTEEYHDFDLHANYIFIKGGRFIMGWPDEPYRGQANIVLHGSHQTPYFRYEEDEEGPPLGAKVMGVFGGLDLHGIPNDIHWTHLAENAEIGSNTITLEDPVDWEIDSEIIVTSSSYDPWQTEIFRITRKSGDSYTLTLNQTLNFKHLGKMYDIPGVDQGSGNRTTYRVAAQVGLLSHNIRIIGEEYTNLYSESFGARLLVGTMADDDSEYTGYARLSNVEFVHTGQEGFTATYDPRFSLTFLDVGYINEVRPSNIKDCSFHHGFATAVGVFGTNGLTVENNIIHHTVNHGVQVWGMSNTLIHNLISLVVWPGTYNGRTETANFDQTAGVEATESLDLVMIENVVAGSERIGYMIPGESCDNPVSLFTDNQAQAVLTGVGIFPTYSLSTDCLLVNGFTVQKAWDFGIYIQANPNMIIRNNLLVDNGMSVFTMPLGPGATSHIKVDKYVHIEENVIIGNSPDFDCNADVMLESNTILSFSSQARPAMSGTITKVGIAYPTHQSGSNEAPRKKWTGIMAYPTIGGIMTVKHTHFVNFNTNQCGERAVVFSPNKNNDDGSHPVELESITQADVDEENKVFIHRPNVGKINPSDCVDMDCDGLKKALLKDWDGSFLGSVGAVIPQSEYEWDGDSRRGLGDYRIPKVMQTDLDGTRLDVDSFAPNKGIIRNPDCEYIDAWQAYHCPEVNYEMLIIESLDKDTEKRRLSPVAVLGNEYIDLINGPQDHGWCNGYTCQERISTFMALVATDQHYDIYLTSTNPQKTRFYLLNTDADDAITIAIYYSNPQRLDVYQRGTYVYPTNTALDEDGEIVYSEPSNDSEFLPTLEEVSGTNYFDREWKLQYITIKGSDPVDIIISPLIIIAFNVPAMTVDDFFGENLVDNLALFLGIDPSRIKVVNIVREESKRKRREAEASVELEINEKPILELDIRNDTEAIELIRKDMINITDQVVTQLQLSNLDSILNITILSADIQEPVPAPDHPTWEDVSSSLTKGTSAKKSIRIPSSMETVEEASQGVEGAGFDITPVLAVIDSLGEHVTLLGSTSSPWQVTAQLLGGDAIDNRSVLIGSDGIGFRLGYANFTNLAITHSGSGYMIRFEVSRPSAANFLSQTMGPFTISSRILSAQTVDLETMVARGQDIDITIEVIDAWTVARAHDIHWKGHTWMCTIEKYTKTGYRGSYNIQENTISINETGMVTFTNLTLSEYGDVAFTFDCVTTPDSEYSFTAYSNVISVRTETPPNLDAIRAVTIKFEENFEDIVGAEDTIFSAAMKNLLLSKYLSDEIVLDNFTASAGSIVVTFIIGGEAVAVENTIESLWIELKNGMVLTYGDTDIQASPYMAVDGEERWPTEDEDSDIGGLHPAILGVIIVLAVALPVTFIIVVVLKYTKSGKSLVGRLRSDSHAKVTVNSDGIVVTDQVPPRRTLYNENTFRTLSGHSSICSPGFGSPLQLDTGSRVSTPSTANSTNPLLERSPEAHGTPNVLRAGTGEVYQPEMRGKQLMVSRQGSSSGSYLSSANSTPLPEPGK